MKNLIAALAVSLFILTPDLAAQEHLHDQDTSNQNSGSMVKGMMSHEKMMGQMLEHDAQTEHDNHQ